MEVLQCLEKYIKQNEKEIKSLIKQLEISQTETKLYKTLLEEQKNKSEEINSLYVLSLSEATVDDYDVSIIQCWGVFTLESSALARIIETLTKSNNEKYQLNIHKIDLKTPYQKESEIFIYSEDDFSMYKSLLKSIEVNKEVYTIYNSEIDTSLLHKRKIVLQI